MNFPNFFAQQGSGSCAPELGDVSSTLARWRDESRFRDGAQLAEARHFSQDSDGHRFLETVFRHSPYLTRILFAETPFFLDLVRRGPVLKQADLHAQLCHPGLAHENTPTLKRVLRTAKRRQALISACADMTGIQTVEETVLSLSAFADAALRVVTDHLLLVYADRGELSLVDSAHPSRGCGYFLFALGKLGGRELNYSSDIDLVALFDGKSVSYGGKKTPQSCFSRLTRTLIGMMEEYTEDGYVFRTDFRLRPDPSSTPIALSTEAAERYYESVGLNWERAALIKARPVAGDLKAADSFLARLNPFIWRKHLDFAALEDIQSVKAQINAHHARNKLSVRRQNLKTGPGGIREIEFLAQSQQLIWGGRKPSLRLRATCDVYRSLAEEGLIDAAVSARMIDCYWRLRRVEHRLQMVDDRQTHSLPEDAAGMAALASFLGVATGAQLERDLLRVMTSVADQYATTVGVKPDGAPCEDKDIPVVLDHPEADHSALMGYVSGLGFAHPGDAARLVSHWLSGQYVATRNERAHRLLKSLLPDLLRALGRSADPDRALTGIDTFLSRLPAGVQIFTLLQSRPKLLDTLAEIMGSAPRLAERLARRPILLDTLLLDDFVSSPPSPKVMEGELVALLGRARDMEDSLDITRRWAKDLKFQLGVGILRNRVDAEATAPIFSDIAEVLLRALQPKIEHDFAARHGVIGGTGLAVVALGKLGGQELTVASDIDLVLIHGESEVGSLSDGDKPLQPTVYFTRLGQRLINAVTAQTSEGELYEVDLRLRPLGRKGPLVSSLSAFTDYQQRSAWTWEHMALTRARVISGPKDLVGAIGSTIRHVLVRERHPDKLAAEVLAMRQRMTKARPGPTLWHIKDMPGGLVDVEFICQYLQLCHAAAHPEILHHNTGVCYSRLAAAGVIDRQVGEQLGRAARFWHRLQGLMRLCFRDNAGREDFSHHLKDMLAAAGKSENFDALERKMADMSAMVRSCVSDIIVGPAQRWGGDIVEEKADHN